MQTNGTVPLLNVASLKLFPQCSVTYLVKKSKEAALSKNTLLEVELLCRIGIFVAHGLNIWTRKSVSTF